MSASTLSLPRPPLPPIVRFIEGRPSFCIGDPTGWRRATPEDEAKMHSGYDRTTHEPCVGVYVVRRPNGVLRIGFDLWKLNTNLRPAAIERLQSRWRQQATSLSKSILRSVLRRSHFSTTFSTFETSSQHPTRCTTELTSSLSNP